MLGSLSRLLPAVKAFFGSLLYYVLVIAGSLLFSYGFWLVYKPLGFMVLGILIVLAAIDSRR